jgi:hypothetical protein
VKTALIADNAINGQPEGPEVQLVFRTDFQEDDLNERELEVISGLVPELTAELMQMDETDGE